MDLILHKKQPPSRLKRKKELLKLLVARSGIHASLNACKLMIENVYGMGHDLYYPLYSSVVVCYSRPFTNNKPHGALPEKWYTFDDSIHDEMHKKILKARHELIAHSDMVVNKAFIVPAGVTVAKNEKKPIVSEHIGVQTTMYYYPLSFFENAYNLCLFQGKRISREIDILLDELYEDMELPNAAFEIRMDNGL